MNTTFSVLIVLAFLLQASLAVYFVFAYKRRQRQIAKIMEERQKQKMLSIGFLMFVVIDSFLSKLSKRK